jgi:hypothetical protein
MTILFQLSGQTNSLQSLHFLRKEMKRYQLWSPKGDQPVLLLTLVFCVLRFKIITCEGLFILICLFRKAISKQETRRSSQRGDQHSASYVGGTWFGYRDRIFGRFLPCLQPNARSVQNSVPHALPLTIFFFLNVTDCCCKPVQVFRNFKSGLSVYFYTFPRFCDIYKEANVVYFPVYCLYSLRH